MKCWVGFKGNLAPPVIVTDTVSTMVFKRKVTPLTKLLSLSQGKHLTCNLGNISAQCWVKSWVNCEKAFFYSLISQRIVFKLMLIVHKSVNNIAPIYISELLKVYTPSHNLRSSNMSLLKEPTSKRTWGDTCRSFSVVAPRLWNHLSTKLKSCHSITRFKSLLKTHLMSQFFKDDVYL